VKGPQTIAPSAPIERALLEPCLTGFPSDARTLPQAAYVSPEIFAWEQEHFLTSSWFCLGRESDLARPGDQKAIEIGGLALLLVRGEERLRAFFNTCRHRGHELLPCGGNPQNDGVIRCPYHRWVYTLDGTFKGGPGMSAQPGFDRTDPSNNLVPVRLEGWRGWLFANVSGKAAPLLDHLGTVDSLIADYEPERMFLGTSHEYDLRANWKIIIENYHECYHCTEIHPELCSVSSPGSGEDYQPTGTVIGGSMELLPHAETMSLDGQSLGRPFRKLSGNRLREVYYLELFPNMLLSIHPDYVMVHRLDPIDYDKTRVECAWFFPPEAKERRDFSPSYASDFWDITNRQDWAACEAVQRGVAGPGYRQSPFSSQELVVHQSMAMVARGYLEGRVRPFDSMPTRSAAGAT
jgi:glycine betaine catabolism A